MVVLKTVHEIETMREGNSLVADTLKALASIIVPGITTMELDEYAETFVRKRGAKPAFKGYRGYPYSLCTSVNEEIVHGFPSERELVEGDIVSIDFGVLYKGYYGDSAVTVPVGKISPKAERLLNVTREALYRGIEKARAGNRLGDVSHAIQSHAETAGFSVVRDFVGHGIGKNLHEDPPIPNYGSRGRGIQLKAGMVLAIEPMINEGTYRVEVKPDGWTAFTADLKLSAHFEHTIAVTDDGPTILSQ